VWPMLASLFDFCILNSWIAVCGGLKATRARELPSANVFETPSMWNSLL
jgi:hypothetical protein